MSTDRNMMSDGEHAQVACTGEPSGARLDVTVIATAADTTLAALRTAATLASGLSCHLRLVAINLVPRQLPLYRPPVPTGFVERSLCELVRDASIEANAITIEICLGRDRRQCLQRILRPRSLVIVDGKTHWWSRRNRLEEWLARQGHDVIFVDTNRPPRPKQ